MDISPKLHGLTTKTVTCIYSRQNCSFRGMTIALLFWTAFVQCRHISWETVFFTGNSWKVFFWFVNSLNQLNFVFCILFIVSIADAIKLLIMDMLRRMKGSDFGMFLSHFFLFLSFVTLLSYHEFSLKAPSGIRAS